MSSFRFPGDEQSEARAHLRLASRVRAACRRQKRNVSQIQDQKPERAAIAVYHATTKPLSRSTGRSSVAAAAYRAGVALVDARTGMTHDFTRRSGVVASFILAPGNAGEFASDREPLWNAAEAAEKRKDSRTAREWILALPSELATEQRVNLALYFARELVERYGVVADVAIHAPALSGDERNHHAHILCTTRMIEGDSFGDKSAFELSDAKRKILGLGSAADEIFALRERWAELANAALEKAGQSARVDHRSLIDQQAAAAERGDLVEVLALQREPQRHVGVHAAQLDRRAGRAISERGKLRERAVAATRHARSAAVRWARELLDLMRPVAEKAVLAEIDGELATDPAPCASSDTQALQLAAAAPRKESPLAALMQKWRQPAAEVPKNPKTEHPKSRPIDDSQPRPERRDHDKKWEHDP